VLPGIVAAPTTRLVQLGPVGGPSRRSWRIAGPGRGRRSGPAGRLQSGLRSVPGWQDGGESIRQFRLRAGPGVERAKPRTCCGSRPACMRLVADSRKFSPGRPDHRVFPPEPCRAVRQQAGPEIRWCPRAGPRRGKKAGPFSIGGTPTYPAWIRSVHPRRPAGTAACQRLLADRALHR